MVRSIVDLEPQALSPPARRAHGRRRRWKVQQVPRLLQRPIIGAVFGAGRFALATRPCIARGLHSVEYMIIEPRLGQVLATSDDKQLALARARDLIIDAERQATLWPEHELRARQPSVPRKPSRRRREVFNRSGGRCAYCSTALKLAGPWHVEHQQPRALDGGDDPLNLVAACSSCNLSKRDQTALEFVLAGPRRV